jgi:hypothetical protein
MARNAVLLVLATLAGVRVPVEATSRIGPSAEQVALVDVSKLRLDVCERQYVEGLLSEMEAVCSLRRVLAQELKEYERHRALPDFQFSDVRFSEKPEPTHPPVLRVVFNYSPPNEAPLAHMSSKPVAVSVRLAVLREEAVPADIPRHRFAAVWSRDQVVLTTYDQARSEADRMLRELLRKLFADRQSALALVQKGRRR